ncbi:MAG: pantetheine-phosphate adenylyltransferase [Chloroflexi bacterium]|nr:pantetheine-phosphate adenylyltransferase [Chloroflexota bacterium]
MTTALFPGTFDPVTNGHLDIIRRGAALFDTLVVGVFASPSKSLLFSTEERVDLLRQAVADLKNVEVKDYNLLTVEFARDVGAKAILRGLRVISDFELESQMAITNRSLAPEIDTVCLMYSQDYQFLSSSIVKEMAKLGGDVSSLVPPHVAIALQNKLRGLNEEEKEKIKIVSLKD